MRIEQLDMRPYLVGVVTQVEEHVKCPLCQETFATGTAVVITRNLVTTGLEEPQSFPLHWNCFGNKMAEDGKTKAQHLKPVSSYDERINRP